MVKSAQEEALRGTRLLAMLLPGRYRRYQTICESKSTLGHSPRRATYVNSRMNCSALRQYLYHSIDENEPTIRMEIINPRRQRSRHQRSRITRPQRQRLVQSPSLNGRVHLLNTGEDRLRCCCCRGETCGLLVCAAGSERSVKRGTRDVLRIYSFPTVIYSTISLGAKNPSVILTPKTCSVPYVFNASSIALT